MRGTEKINAPSSCDPTQAETAWPSVFLWFKLTTRSKNLGEWEKYSSFAGSEVPGVNHEKISD